MENTGARCGNGFCGYGYSDAQVQECIREGIENERPYSFSCGLEIKPVAVLTTTILPLDGVYAVKRDCSIPDLTGIPHYIGHPATKTIVEQLGAIPAPTKLFPGLQPGEYAVCFAIKQGMSNRKADGFTIPHQDVTIEDLDIRFIYRIE